MPQTQNIIIAIDGSAEQGGFTYIQDSPVGPSKPGYFKWPFGSNGSLPEIDKWFMILDDKPPIELGQQIFGLLFPKKIRTELYAALKSLQPSDRVLIGISSRSPQIYSIPLEIAHNGEEYLVSANRILFRYINDGVNIEPRLTNLRRFLFVLAEPKSGEYSEWGHDYFAEQITETLHGPDIELDILKHANPEELQSRLGKRRGQGNAYDVIFVVAHGEAASPLEDGYLVLEDENGNPSLFNSDKFATAITGHQGCLVALCSCSSAKSEWTNPLASIAQRLIFSGQAGAVIAMQRPITKEKGLLFAKNFVRYLQEGSNVFDAYRDSSSLATSAGWEHGVPCLYSRLPREDKENQPLTQQPRDQEAFRMNSLFYVDPHKSRFVFILPSFQMGLKADDFERAKAEKVIQIPEGTYYYRGKTSAITDFGAIKDMIAILGRLFEMEEVQNRIVLATDEQAEDLFIGGEYTHYVLVGSKSHKYSRQILKQYSEDFEFSFTEKDWSIIDKRENKKYTVPDPSQTAESPDPKIQYEGMDYAIIEKIIDEVASRVVFIIAGMWDTSTLAAGKFLIEHREDIYQKFGAGGFQYLLEIPAGSTRVKSVKLERSPRRAEENS